MQTPLQIWQQLRPYLLNRGNGELHGDDHDDADCLICQTIKTLDEEIGK